MAPTTINNDSDLDEADIYIDDDLAGYYTSGAYDIGGIGFNTVLHEIGHALGLTHPSGLDKDTSLFAASNGLVVTTFGKQAITP